MWILDISNRKASRMTTADRDTVLPQILTDNPVSQDDLDRLKEVRKAAIERVKKQYSPSKPKEGKWQVRAPLVMPAARSRTR